MHNTRHILPIPRTCIWRRCGRCGVSWHRFPIGGSEELSFCLQPFYFGYLAQSILGSRFCPFRVPWCHWSRDHL